MVIKYTKDHFQARGRKNSKLSASRAHETARLNRSKIPITLPSIKGLKETETDDNDDKRK